MNEKYYSFLLASICLVILQACSVNATQGAASEPKNIHWQPQTKLPTPLQEVYPAVFDEKIYVAGAFEQSAHEHAVLAHLAASKSTYVYHEQSKKWTRGPVLPESRHHLGLIASDNVLYAIGGFNATSQNAWQVKRTVFTLQKGRGTWGVGPHLPIPMGESVYGVINGYVHVAGGRTLINGKLSDTNAHWVLKAGRWQQAAPLPIASNSATSVVINDQWYVMGGRVNALDFKNLDNLWRYDVKQDSWERLANMPQASAGLASAVFNGQIYVFGGEEYTYTMNIQGEREMKTRTFDGIWRYDPDSNLWHTEPSKMTSTRHGLGAVSTNNHIYLLGGAKQAGATGTSATFERMSLQ
ncbi:Kelch repeat-containing protein [Pseudoalteromonas luteoviolacea]|nr:kelch repeat-containing protein [Pseudoalteromonas luteoviolacea]